MVFVLRTFVRFFYLEHCREAKRRLLECRDVSLAKVNETSGDENRN